MVDLHPSFHFGLQPHIAAVRQFPPVLPGD